jgi:hypothetical protein
MLKYHKKVSEQSVLGKPAWNSEAISPSCRRIMHSMFLGGEGEGRKCQRNIIYAEAKAMGIILQNMPRFTENSKNQMLKVICAEYYNYTKWKSKLIKRFST